MRKMGGILLTVIVLTVSIYAADYYVSPAGTASWPSCTAVNTPCSLGTANSNAKAGDIIYLLGGTYQYTAMYTNALTPANSGTAGSWIAFRNAPGESPEIRGTYGTRMWGLMIDGKSYIHVEGIIFTDFTDHLIRSSAHHIEISNCTFRGMTSPYRSNGFQMVEACADQSGYTCPVHDIWLHHNTFYKLAAGGGCSSGGISEGGDPVRIGYYSMTCNNGRNCAQGLNQNITVEDNYMAYGGHCVMDSYSIRSVFKNNVAHNEPWYPADNGNCTVTYQPVYDNAAYNGLYSHRVWAFTDTYSRNYSYNLIEANRLGYGGVNPNNDGATSLTIASPGNIIRFNSAYGSMHNSMKTKYGTNYGWQASGGINNRIYQNTLYKNGYGYPFFQTCTGAQVSTCPKPLRGFRWYAPDQNPGNILVNNIVYGSYGAAVKGNNDVQDSNSGSQGYNNLCTLPDAKCTVVGDPQFVNPDLTQTTSKILPDLHLLPASPAINNGTFLTEAVNSGSDSLTLTVKDALFFQDASWGASMARGVTMFPDWIAIGSVDKIVQISSIDYASNTITLASPMTWNSNDKIWLYKDSSGNKVLYGSAPDIGAYEFEQSGSICSAADSDADGKVTVSELISYVSSWKSGGVTLTGLMKAVGEWKNGC